MSTLMKKLVIAGALIAAASAASAQAADQSGTFSAAEDQRITNEVEAAIASDPRLSGTVEVQTKDGVVTLEGLLTTSGEVERARLDAESVEGLREVDNHIKGTVGMDF